MERWTGRTAVVTGASSGIGAAIAQELVKRGLKVVGLARRVERVEDMSAVLNSEPGKLFPLKCDISKEEDIKEAFQWIKTNLGGVDILINNAGTVCHNSLINGPVDRWRQMLDLNVLGVSICTKEALQSMKERGVHDGHIVNMNSIFGHTLPPIEFGCIMYSATKHAITVLTEGLRRELVKSNSKIRVTSISPGIVDTEMIPRSILEDFPYLHAKDVADGVIYVLAAPPNVQIHELTIRSIGDVL